MDRRSRLSREPGEGWFWGPEGSIRIPEPPPGSYEEIGEAGMAEYCEALRQAMAKVDPRYRRPDESC